jgi:glycine/D-amino acid oxidase-like deaminating enzyme
MTGNLFAPSYKPEPFWWERSPLAEPSEQELPAQADVAIIGSGYTGLNAAIQTARGGRHTVVIEANAIGSGCSSRNGGQISTSIKTSYADLAAKHGEKLAYDIVKEGHNALQWIGENVEREGLDCDFRKVGRFMAGHTPGQFEKIAKSIENPPKGLETEAYVVPKAEQHTEIDSPDYHGGVVFPRHASIDPGAYHKGLLGLALEAGATVIGHCRADGVSGSAGDLTVHTAKGPIKARNVIVATSGYTGGATPWQQRRIIPIGSYIIATEPLEPELIQRLIPKQRVISDSRKLVVYYRTDPAGERIVFGGRVSVAETNPTAAAPALHAEMVKRFPDLAGRPITHAWMGFVGYTFDEMPHLGARDGIHYSMGYCGSGVSLASYFGTKIGQQVLGLSDGDSPLTKIDFPTRPYYWGKPWFLAPSIRYYRWKDERVA